MAGSNEDRDRSRRPSAKDRRWSGTSRVLGGWMVGRLGDVVCCMHRARKDKEREFLG
jgi:hypothetical protein